MGVATEMLVKNQIKESGEVTVGWLSAVLDEQRRTNALLEELIGVMQGQPRVFHPQGAPWQEAR